MLKNSSPMASGNGAPNTAIELANTRRGLCAGGAHRFQQAARAVHVDAVALVELLLGLARHDGGQMEDRHRACRRPACPPRPAAGRSPVSDLHRHLRRRPARAPAPRRTGSARKSALPPSSPSLASRSASLRPIMPAPPMIRTFMDVSLMSFPFVIPGLVPGEPVEPRAPAPVGHDGSRPTSAGMTAYHPSDTPHASVHFRPSTVPRARPVLAADPARCSRWRRSA